MIRESSVRKAKLALALRQLLPRPPLPLYALEGPPLLLTPGCLVADEKGEGERQAKHEVLWLSGHWSGGCSVSPIVRDSARASAYKANPVSSSPTITLQTEFWSVLAFIIKVHVAHARAARSALAPGGAAAALAPPRARPPPRAPPRRRAARAPSTAAGPPSFSHVTVHRAARAAPAPRLFGRGRWHVDSHVMFARHTIIFYTPLWQCP